MSNDDADLGLSPVDLAALSRGTACAELNDRIRAVTRRGPAPTVPAPLTDVDDQAVDTVPAPLTVRFGELVRAQLDCRG